MWTHSPNTGSSPLPSEDLLQPWRQWTCSPESWQHQHTSQLDIHTPTSSWPGGGRGGRTSWLPGSSPCPGSPWWPGLFWPSPPPLPPVSFPARSCVPALPSGPQKLSRQTLCAVCQHGGPGTQRGRGRGQLLSLFTQTFAFSLSVSPWLSVFERAYKNKKSSC